jgi:hypothetical protein
VVGGDREYQRFARDLLAPDSGRGGRGKELVLVGDRGVDAIVEDCVVCLLGLEIAQFERDARVPGGQLRQRGRDQASARARERADAQAAAAESGCGAGRGMRVA